MRAAIIVLLGCLPLTYLTVQGFLKPDPDMERFVEHMDPAFAIAREQASKPPKVVQPPTDEPIGDDLLSGGTFESYPTKGKRPRWVRAQQLLVGLLDTDKPTDPADIEASTQAKQQLQQLKVDCTEPPLPGGRAIVAILDRRIGTLTKEIDMRQEHVKSEAERQRLTEEGKRLLAEARAAFKGKKYAECLTLCDRLIEIHSQGIETIDLAKLQEVKKMAAARDRFVKEDARLSTLLKPQDGVDESRLRGHLAELQKALGRWRADDDTALLAAEQRERRTELADELKRRRDEIEGELGSKRQAMTLAELEGSPSKDFFARLRQAEKVLDLNPTDDVKKRLRSLIVRSIGESLPVKAIDEPDWMRYATSKHNKKISGHFKPLEEVPEDEQLGWRVSAAPESPEGIVWRLSNLLGPPAKSPARQCVDDYNDARKQLLASPQDKALWAGFATLCENLQGRWEAAQDEFGSTEELSFKVEGRFARQILGADSWGRIEKLLGKGEGKKKG